MTEEEFWKLIEGAKESSDGDCDRQVRLIHEVLKTLPLKELVSFDENLNQKMALAYHWDLWGAAYIINGGCSDDGFEYFLGWLILQGKKVFEDALKDPETLVNVAKPEVENQDILCAAGYIFCKQTNKTYRDFPRRDVRNRFNVKGEQWDEDEVNKRFPRLAQKFA